MPSRQPPPFPLHSPPSNLPPSASPPTQFYSSGNLVATPPPRLLPPMAGVVAGFSFFLCLLVFFRKLWRKRTVPADSKPPYRYSYSSLRGATSSFSAAYRLGQGGFGSVYRGTLKSGKEVAVKVMDSGSLQGEREFQNELFFAGRIDSGYVVPLIGFCSDRRRQRMILIYELMSNGNLQDALLDRKCSELMDWKKRFDIAMDVAKGIEYLHSLDPPVIHGDIKPSNILLDRCFSAKIGDLGLARLKSEDQVVVVVVEGDAIKMNGREEVKKKELMSSGGGAVDDNVSVAEDAESVATAFEEMTVNVEQSPETFVLDAVTSSPGSETFDRASNESLGGKRKKNMVGKDGWPRLDNVSMEVGSVKDYVREWMKMEVRNESLNDHWTGTSSSGANLGQPEKKEKSWKKEKRRPAREWWKEEFCEELAKKKKKKKMKRQKREDENIGGENWWPTDEDMYVDRKKKSRRSSRGGSKGSVDWWLDGLSGELWRARRNSHDSAGGEIPKSGGISSTPSMRGTMCYVAPEYGGSCGDVSEKCDVYSFGVLLLVVISGRRPLQVTASPMAEFQKANLISWARKLARSGKLINLVDQSIQSLDREQALSCIMVALMCLQKSPARRPSMKEVVGMLSGDSGPPELPFEFSPSPPSRFPFKSQKKVR